MTEEATRTDEELIQGVIAKDEAAFAELYERYAPMVRRAVYRMCPQDDVEDVVQAVFMRVFERINLFNGESKFSTWLRHIAINHTRDLYRRREAREGDNWVSTDTVWDNQSGGWLLGVDVGADDPRLEFAGDLERLQRLIDCLPVKMQEVVLARMYGFPMVEIAKKQGRVASSVRSDYNRAVKLLKTWMCENGKNTTVSGS